MSDLVLAGRWRSSGFWKMSPVGSMASVSSQAFPANVQWFRSCGSMKWANGLLMAYRRMRITLDLDGFLTRLNAVPIDAAQQVPTEILELPIHRTKTQCDELRRGVHRVGKCRFRLPLATTDAELRRAAAGLVWVWKRCFAAAEE